MNKKLVTLAVTAVAIGGALVVPTAANAAPVTASIQAASTVAAEQGPSNLRLSASGLLEWDAARSDTGHVVYLLRWSPAQGGAGAALQSVVDGTSTQILDQYRSGRLTVTAYQGVRSGQYTAPGARIGAVTETFDQYTAPAPTMQLTVTDLGDTLRFNWTNPAGATNGPIWYYLQVNGGEFSTLLGTSLTVSKGVVRPADEFRVVAVSGNLSLGSSNAVTLP